MSSYINDEQIPEGATDEESVVLLCRQRYRLADDAEAQGRQDRLDDVRFVRLREQWPSYAAAGRNLPGRERPMLVDNRLLAYRNQVINEIRMNSPNIQVRPVDDQADVKTAEVFEGIIRHVNAISNGDAAIDTAAEWQVDTGLGYIEIEPDWVSPDSWDQELFIRRCEDPTRWWYDPHSVAVDGSDATFAIKAVDMLKREFEAKYPGVDATGFESLDYGVYDGWLTKDSIRVAKYYWMSKERTRATHPGTGQTVWRESKRVFCSIIAGDKELERTELLFTPGDEFVPVVPVYGLDTWIDGKRHLEGLIRNAKDPQRMLNFAESAKAEHVALVTKSPWVGTAEQFEGRPEWDDPNTPWAKMVYNPVSHMGQVLPPPSRSEPPQPNNAWTQIEQQAILSIQAAMGIYEGALGANPNEQSGKALLSIQRQQSQGTFHFSDNLGRSLKQVARILVSMIPRYYDARVVARIIGEDGGQEHARLDPQMQQSMAEIQQPDGSVQRIYNLGVGRFDVVCDVGPSYATKRQESAESALQLIQAVPQVMGVAGDLIVKQLDWPMAQDISERIKKSLPPNLTQDETQQSPEAMQAQQQLEQMAQQMEQMGQMVHDLQAQLEDKQAEIRIKAYEAETHRIAATKQTPEAEPDYMGQELSYVTAHAQHELDEQRLELERAKAERDYELKVAELTLKREQLESSERQAAAQAAQKAADDETRETAKMEQAESSAALKEVLSQLETIKAAHTETMQGLTDSIAAMSKPRKRQIVYDPKTNRPVGMEDLDDTGAVVGKKSIIFDKSGKPVGIEG